MVKPVSKFDFLYSIFIKCSNPVYFTSVKLQFRSKPYTPPLAIILEPKYNVLPTKKGPTRTTDSVFNLELGLVFSSQSYT